MQTIEQFINSKILELFGDGDLDNVSGDINSISEGIKIGVEFSQRWIPVEKEHPTKGIEIIVKNKHRKVVYEVKTNDDVKYICENFTSWRPVELK